MHAGVPVAPMSPAYSLMSKDFAKLKSIFELLRAGPRVLLGPGAASRRRSPRSARRPPRSRRCSRRRRAHASTRRSPGSGPTRSRRSSSPPARPASPKGVINTHRMLCSNQQMAAQVWPFLEDRPPVLVDWLPWNHTFGGNFCFNMIAAERRHASYRRRQADARSRRDHRAQPEGDLADRVLQRPARLRPAAAVPRAGRGACGRASSATSSSSSTPPRRCRRTCGSGSRRSPPRPGPRPDDVLGLGLDRDRAARDRGALAHRSRRRGRRPGPRLRAEARALRRQARGARARAERDARLLPPRRPDAERLRRGRLLPDRRRAPVRRPR